MSLNVKSAEAHDMAAELARLTGESMTKAVTEAIPERLQRERKKRYEDKLVEDVLAIGRRGASYPRKDRRPHGAFLYDERGCPANGRRYFRAFGGEPEAAAFARAIGRADQARIATANLLEAGIVADHQDDSRAGRQLDSLVARLGLIIEPVTEHHVRLARQA